jgi:hypothetical protein
MDNTTQKAPRREIVRREIVCRGYTFVPGFGSVDRSYVRLHLACGHTAEYFPSQAPRKFVRCLDCAVKAEG